MALFRSWLADEVEAEEGVGPGEGSGTTVGTETVFQVCV